MGYTSSTCCLVLLVCMWSTTTGNGQDLQRLRAAIREKLPYEAVGIEETERKRALTVVTRALSQYWQEQFPARLNVSLFKQLSDSCFAGWVYFFNRTWT